MLEGPVLKSIILMAIPIIFANMFQTVYQLIDTFWVGRLGAEAVAAVSLSAPLVFFLTSLAMGIAMAGTILIAQYNGKKDKKNVSLAAGQTFSLVMSIAIVLTIFGYLIAGFLLSFMTKDPVVLEQAISYLKISFLAMPAMFIYSIFQSSLRGVGEVKFPMYVIITTVILNFFLDPIFMFGWRFIPAMGVAGVAWATLITEYISAIIGIIVLMVGFFDIKITLSDLKLKFSWITRLFKLGVPSSLEMSSRSFSMVLMTFIVSTFGTIAIASFGIGIRVLMFVIIPAIAFSISSTALIGNNLGARQHSRSEEIAKTGMKIGFWSLSVIGLILFVFAKHISGFFVPNEPEVIKSSALFIRMMSLTFGFIGIQMVVSGTLKAAGKTILSMSLAFTHTLSLFVIGFLLAIVFKLGVLGIWIAYPLANFIGLMMGVYLYRKKEWLNTIV